MPNCEDRCSASGIEFKTWTGNNSGNPDCYIPNQDDTVYQFVGIINLRGGSGFIIDIKAYAGNAGNFVFKHINTTTRSSGWENKGIHIPPYSKKRSLVSHQKSEATVICVVPNHGRDTIHTEFTYTPQSNPSQSIPPARLAFNVSF